MTISILILLRLPDDVLTMTMNRVFSTGLRAYSQHHILVLFANIAQTFEAILPHMIAHSNLSFKQCTSTTDKRINSISLYLIREDTCDAYSGSFNGSPKRARKALVHFSFAELSLT
jgi:hypothetical protein